MEYRLTMCTVVLESWSRSIRRERKGEAEKYKSLMDIYRDSHDTYLSDRYLEAHNEYNKVLLKEDVYWKQRAKMHWLGEEDLNTKFFRMSAKARKNLK